jgi:hypothetical protein
MLTVVQHLGGSESTRRAGWHLGDGKTTLGMTRDRWALPERRPRADPVASARRRRASSPGRARSAAAPDELPLLPPAADRARTHGQPEQVRRMSRSAWGWRDSRPVRQDVATEGIPGSGPPAPFGRSRVVDIVRQ